MENLSETKFSAPGASSLTFRKPKKVEKDADVKIVGNNLEFFKPYFSSLIARCIIEYLSSMIHCKKSFSWLENVSKFKKFQEKIS